MYTPLPTRDLPITVGERFLKYLISNHFFDLKIKNFEKLKENLFKNFSNFSVPKKWKVFGLNYTISKFEYPGGLKIYF